MDFIMIKRHEVFLVNKTFFFREINIKMNLNQDEHFHFNLSPRKNGLTRRENGQRLESCSNVSS